MLMNRQKCALVSARGINKKPPNYRDKSGRILVVTNCENKGYGEIKIIPAQ